MRFHSRTDYCKRSWLRDEDAKLLRRIQNQKSFAQMRRISESCSLFLVSLCLCVESPASSQTPWGRRAEPEAASPHSPSKVHKHPAGEETGIICGLTSLKHPHHYTKSGSHGWNCGSAWMKRTSGADQRSDLTTLWITHTFFAGLVLISSSGKCITVSTGRRDSGVVSGKRCVRPDFPLWLMDDGWKLESVNGNVDIQP